MLTEEQAQELRKQAAAEGRSMADLVRDGVDAILGARPGGGREHAKSRALASVGHFRSGVSDLGTRHDAHLTDAWKP